MSSVLCQAWQKQVQEFFTQLHGHQSKTLAWFVASSDPSAKPGVAAHSRSITGGK